MPGTTYTDDDVVSFNYSDGYLPYSGLIADAAGDLFGTTEFGGANGFGEAFEIKKDSSTPTGYASTPIVLASFTNAGGFPIGGLIMDAAGDLFGTNSFAGGNGKGEVFEIAKTSTGFDAPAAVAYFSGDGASGTGAEPTSTLIDDAAGDLFGTTVQGGLYDDGVVYEIVKSGGVYASTPTVLFSFDDAPGNTDGGGPFGGLIRDAAGDLIGTTRTGGAGGEGEVFELVKDDSSSTGYDKTLTVLYSFTGDAHGGSPDDTLITDASGDLFGTTYSGGATGHGVVFEIAKTVSGYASTPTVLASFDGIGTVANPGDGQGPDDKLLMDSKGDLFGTTAHGGVNDDGVVFEIAYDSTTGYAATPTVLFSFSGTDGANPEANLIFNSAGDLLLTTSAGGANGDGAVIELTPHNAPCYCRGARILTERGEIAVEDLAIGDLVITASAELRPIVWIGYREIEVARHAFPVEILPVRVRKGAFGQGLPHRDLWLSPQHAVYLGGVLIPIVQLANGASVAQMRVETVSYFHVELESHDVLLAEGLPAESFLDCGSRSGFSNCEGFVELHPTFKPLNWDDACAPFMQDGEEVEANRRRLLAQAERLGFEQSCDPGLHLLADGEIVWPEERDDGWRHFVAPANVRSLKLASRSWRPADAGASGDKRHLGVAVAEVLYDGRNIDLAALEAGWHPLEAEDGHEWRWSDGSASLPVGGRQISVRLVGEPLFWVEANAGSAGVLREAA